MLGRISTVTITTPDLPAAARAYQRHLGYRVVADGALGRDTARSWGRPNLAGNRSFILEPESGAETCLRFVQGPAYADYQPFACFGWNAAELVVQDVDGLADRLRGSPFRTIGPPADRSFTDRIRAMTVVGPASEVLYLTEIKEKLPIFDTPEATSPVDRVFMVILGGASLEALQDCYHLQFGLGREPAVPSVVSVMSAQYGLPMDHRHLIAALKVGGQCYIETDEMPQGAVTRPCEPGQLPPAISMVSFEVPRLPEILPSALGPVQRCHALPYDGRRSVACVGAAGELIELVEAG
jgi:catechol 2,3-dioxygenase-like lactoylglutathione lyase family enzyme